MRRHTAVAALASTLISGVASVAEAQVKVERLTYLKQPDCIRLSNGTVELIVTTAIGPRIIRYGFIGGDNLLGEVPDARVKTTLGEWKPWGGHRLWTAPEDMPRSYSPDNSPVQATVTGSTVTLVQPVEPQTGIVKELTVTLAESGTGVVVGHRLVNRSLWTVSVAPWALTIMNTGGTILIPQEPYASHDDALLPVRAMTLWAYTDLSDPRWRIGPKFVRLSTDSARADSEKIGVANTRGWAGYARNGQLFVKRYGWQPGATYPDNGVNTETYTAGAFIELETLGPIQALAPGAAATHEERWSLFRDVDVTGDDSAVERALAPHLATLGLK
jgi:hypothetical protein